jgi:hypothetical protein
MKNTLACTLSILAFGLCASTVFAQKDTFSYVFTVSNDTICWKKVPAKELRFKVISRTSCEFTLMLGGNASDTLKIKGSGFDTLYQLDSGKLKLPGGKKLPLPDSVSANIQILWDDACETKKGSEKVDVCPAGSSKKPKADAPNGGPLTFIPSSEDEADFQKIASAVTEDIRLYEQKGNRRFNALIINAYFPQKTFCS